MHARALRVGNPLPVSDNQFLQGGLVQVLGDLPCKPVYTVTADINKQINNAGRHKQHPPITEKSPATAVYSSYSQADLETKEG